MSLFETAVGRLAAVGTVGALVLGGAVLGTSTANAADSDRMVGPWVTLSWSQPVYPPGLDLPYLNVWTDQGGTQDVGLQVRGYMADALALAQEYEMPKPDTAAGPIVNMVTGRCLTRGPERSVFGDISATAHLDTCVEGQASQQWKLVTRPDGFVVFTQGGWYMSNGAGAAAIIGMVLSPNFHPDATDSLATGDLMRDVVAATAPVTATVDSVDHDVKSAVISGTGEPGATIEIDTPTGTVTTTVDGDGTWSATAPGLAEGENELPIRQVIDGETTDSTTVTVIINVLNPPVAHPAMAGGALALALGGLLLHRRKKATVS